MITPVRTAARADIEQVLIDWSMKGYRPFLATREICTRVNGILHRNYTFRQVEWACMYMCRLGLLERQSDGTRRRFVYRLKVEAQS